MSLIKWVLAKMDNHKLFDLAMDIISNFTVEKTETKLDDAALGGVRKLGHVAITAMEVSDLRSKKTAGKYAYVSGEAVGESIGDISKITKNKLDQDFLDGFMAGYNASKGKK